MMYPDVAGNVPFLGTILPFGHLMDIGATHFLFVDEF
jgi:hypothetical protein